MIYICITNAKFYLIHRMVGWFPEGCAGFIVTLWPFFVSTITHSISSLTISLASIGSDNRTATSILDSSGRLPSIKVNPVWTSHFDSSTDRASWACPKHIVRIFNNFRQNESYRWSCQSWRCHLFDKAQIWLIYFSRLVWRQYGHDLFPLLQWISTLDSGCLWYNSF